MRCVCLMCERYEQLVAVEMNAETELNDEHSCRRSICFSLALTLPRTHSHTHIQYTSYTSPHTQPQPMPLLSHNASMRGRRVCGRSQGDERRWTNDSINNNGNNNNKYYDRVRAPAEHTESDVYVLLVVRLPPHTHSYTHSLTHSPTPIRKEIIFQFSHFFAAITIDCCRPLFTYVHSQWASVWVCVRRRLFFVYHNCTTRNFQC